MAGTDEADDNRLIGRMPRAARRDVGSSAPAADEAGAGGDADTGDGDEAPDDHEIEAVNRLMGFLRGTDDA